MERLVTRICIFMDICDIELNKKGMDFMEDLTIEIGNGVLNCRAAVIIKHDGKILFHKNVDEPYYALVGGRVKITESSDETVKREVKEEMGKNIELIGYVATIENFFEHKGRKVHEIMFVHQAEFVDKDDKKIVDTIRNVEEEELSKGKIIQYEWLDIDKLDQYDIRPSVIKDVLQKKKYPVHMINKGI